MEDLIHLLERATSGLREEEVHAGHHGGVDYSENDVRAPRNVSKSHRRDHHDHEVECPVSRGGNSVRRRTDGKRCYFCRVEPGHAQPSDSEEGVEDEEHDGCDQSASLVADVAGGSCKDAHSCTHTGSTEQHQLAAAKAFNGENGDPRCDEVLSAVTGS